MTPRGARFEPWRSTGVGARRSCRSTSVTGEPNERAPAVPSSPSRRNCAGVSEGKGGVLVHRQKRRHSLGLSGYDSRRGRLSSPFVGKRQTTADRVAEDRI